MRVLFVAGFGPVLPDRGAGAALYVDALGLPLDRDDDGYLHTARLPGVKHFAVWPLSQAARSCFGTDAWPEGVPVPQAWIEFDVDDVGAATAELATLGYSLLVAAREQPWGQTVTRLLGPEGLLVGITFTPWMRGDDARPDDDGPPIR